MTEYANYVKYFEEKENDCTKRDGPTIDLDWKNAKVFVKFLQTFHNVTLKFSGFTYVTSNIYFTEISGIQDELLLVSGSSNSSNSFLLEDMARGMQQKYNKYWGNLKNINGNLLLTVVFDPRYKFGYIKHCLEGFYDQNTCDAQMNELEDDLRKMFNEYNELHFGIKATTTKEVETQPSPLGTVRSARHNCYMQLRRNQDGGRIKNEVDRYINEACEDIIDGQSFDILKWWSVNSGKYKILSRIARDVLAFPITTIC